MPHKEQTGVARHLAHLRETIDDAQRAASVGAWPFAAQIVAEDGQVLSRTANRVLIDSDPTAHAEVTAIRLAVQAGHRALLGRATLYSSAEPCAMCAGAIHWAGIGTLVYGVGGERLRALYGVNPPFTPLLTSAREILAGGSSVEVYGPLIEDEAAAPLAGFWA